ncbi:MAG: glycosyltransferase family 2 protein [Acidimicrobiia bacterium]
MTPLVSVVMPVCNGMPFLKQSLESIQEQSLTDIEIIVFDNGSTDGSGALIRRSMASDERVRYHRRDSPMGIASSSNAAVDLSRAPLIARMDADDVAHKDRLRRQMGTFERFPDAVLVGTLHDGIDSRGKRVMPRDRGRLFSRRATVPFCHGSVMFRRDAFEAIGGYRAEVDFWTDMDLYFRLSEMGPIVVITDALYTYRFHGGNHSNFVEPETMISSVAELRQVKQARKAGREGSGGQTLGPDAASIESARAQATGLHVWAGHKPPAWTIARRPRGAGSGIGSWMRTALLTYGARLSPRMTRFLLRLYVRARDLLATVRLGGKEHVIWRFER